MTPSMLFAVSVLGGLVGLGAWLILMAATGRQVFGQRSQTQRTAKTRLDNVPRRVIIGIAGGFVVGLATRWPVAGLVAGIGFALFWGRLGSTREAELAAAKGEAIAGWTEQVSSSVRAGQGTNSAIHAAARYSPELVRPQARRLALDLDSMSTRRAIMNFAEALDDPTGDSVCAAIALSVESGSDITEVLAVQAESARAQVRQLREVTASRGEVRTSTRAVIFIVLAMMAAVKFMASDFLAFYDSASGQMALLVVGAMFLLCLYLLTNLMKHKTRPRYFSSGPGTT